MNPINMRVLTLQHYGETETDNLEITLSAMSIKMIAAKDSIIQNRPIKETTILFMDSETVELNLNSLDYQQLTGVVGAYGFFEE